MRESIIIGDFSINLIVKDSSVYKATHNSTTWTNKRSFFHDLLFVFLISFGNFSDHGASHLVCYISKCP